MSAAPLPPLVAVSCCRKPTGYGTAHSVGDKYVDALVDGAGAVPVLVPALAERLDIGALVGRIDGLMLTGSPSNVGPSLYGGPPARPGVASDPLRDGTTLPLIRDAIACRLPVFAVCRGIQELNVALGGSLHQHVHEVEGRMDHRSNKTIPHLDRHLPVHEIRLAEGGLLQRLIGGAATARVNSLHAQAIDRLGEGLAVEAVAEDGTIEAVSLADERGFCLGVQWHPEYRVREHPFNLALFEAFGAACRQRAEARAQG